MYHLLLQTLTPLEWLSQYIHVLSWPAVVGIIGWLAWRIKGALDTFNKAQSADRTTALETQKTATDVKTTLGIIQTNHLAHLATDMAEQTKKQDATIEVLGAQTAILQSIDKGISTLTAVIMDRGRV